MTSPFNPRDVEVLAAALPPQGANPIGHPTRHVVLMHTRRSTPGSTPERVIRWYRDIFFPNIGVSPYEGEVARLTGLDHNFFRNLSVTLVCQRIYEVSSRLRPVMRAAAIASDLARFTDQLRQSSYRFYAYMAGQADSPIKTALAAFPDGPSRTTAKQHYLAGLTSASWVNSKLVENQNGDWLDRDWELFHHWIKLTALGASVDEINAAITQMKNLGLPVPPALDPGVWMKQASWLERGFSGEDAADATDGILKEICSNHGRGVSCQREVYAFWFTADRTGGPGHPYRDQNAGSCFAPGTRVVMGDGSLRPIEEIVAGDQVRTPSGPREVLLRSAPLRGERALLQFAGTRFAFTPSHPFLVAPTEPAAAAYAAAEPDALARNVPTLSQFGIAPLNGSAPAVLLRHTAGGDVPFPAPAIHKAAHLPDLVHDLYLAVGADGRSEYYAGDDDVQLLVSSEVPRFAAAPEATAVMLHILRQAGPTMLQVLKDVPDRSFEDLLCVGLDCLATTMMSTIGPQLRVGNDGAVLGALRGADSTAELAASVRDFATGMTAMPDGDRRRTGVMVEQFAARFGPQFMAVLAMPWRSFDLAEPDVANMLALTPYSLDLFRPGPPVGEAQIEVSLVRGRSSATRRLRAKLGAPADRWYYGVDTPAYFPEWSPPGPAVVWRPSAEAGDEEDMLWQVEIVLQGDQGCRMALPLPREIGQGYQEFRAPLIGARDETVGQALFDVRLLTLEAYVAEREARDAARERTDLTPLTNRLARLAAEFVEMQFADAILLFGNCTAAA